MVNQESDKGSRPAPTTSSGRSIAATEDSDLVGKDLSLLGVRRLAAAFLPVATRSA
jgi:hypothetical protein